MGKKGGSTSSWLTAVKRAFRSPTKESTDKRTSRSRGEPPHDQDVDDEEKKREKRRWIFRKPTSQETAPIQQKAATPPPADQSSEQRHAIAVAVATAAAAEAAVATAQAAVEVARLARPSYHAREHYAAIVIQTTFRGYLARRALRALKGLVKLQALVRGHNVRKQAKMTLRCMQALVRVQARILDQRIRLSHDGSRKSTFSDTASLIESRYLQDLSDRKSMSREGSSCNNAEDWDERPHTIEEVKAMLQQRKDAALKRERHLSHGLSHQIWSRNGRSPSVGSEAELQAQPQQWLDRWMAAKPWDSSSSSRGRASTDHRDPIKTVEMDSSSSHPYTYLAGTASHPSSNNRRPSSNQRPSSPVHRSKHQTHHHSPAVTPSPSRTRPPVQVRSASPRSCLREDCRSSSSTFVSSQSHTPSLRSNYHYTGNLLNHQLRSSNSSATQPNYMAATESARARSRSQSAPRQRPSTPERDGGNRGSGAGGCAKKRLSFPVPDAYGQYPLRSPSFKSVSSSAYFGGLEQQSNYSSCYTESVIGCGEVSPSSTGDLRRRLR